MPVSMRAIAALFIERQHLERPRSRRLTSATLERFVEDTGGLQIDSINVLERAHYLTAWSRFGAYDRAAFDRIAYDRRVLFEYWAHAACLVPTSHLNWWRRAMADYHIRHTGWAKWLKKNAAMLAAVEAAVREQGPIANAHFTREGKRGGAAGWWNWKPATHALHYLWMTGTLMIHSRAHFQKRFDLAERLFPDLRATEPPTSEAFTRWWIERSLHAMGVASEQDLRGYLTFPRLERGKRKSALASMIESGEVVALPVEGERAPWFALARDIPALERAGRRRIPAHGTTLLAPFDSFLWHRARAERLFGFNYRIEVYTPGPKRVHGYYSLPIFHDGQLIGRLDAKNHRQARWLEVRHVHFESWFAAGDDPPAASWGALDRDRALSGIAEAIGSLMEFAAADRVRLVRVTPAKLKAPLRAQLARLVPTDRSDAR